MFVVRDKAHGGMVRGIDPDRLFLKPMISEKLDMNILVQLLDNGNIIVGSALAEQLGVTKGDEIKIIIPSGSTTLLGTIPRSKTFKVIGTFDVGLYQYNSTTVFVNLHDAQRLFKYNESVSEIEVMVSDPERNLDQVKADIAKFSGGQVYMVDWKMAQAKWLSALAVERAVMFFILMLIILVAVFNIISSLIMLVKDKSKAIAILRTMGAYKSSIIRIFMIAGTAIGLIGSTSGVLLGVLVAKNLDNIKALVENLSGVTLFDPVVYFLTQLPSDLYMSDVVLIFGLSFTLSVIATIYPAYRASKLLPTEVLRYE
ncbi:MAG: FtsX-like permease family protein [Alphaproteobacteria bacterium]